MRALLRIAYFELPAHPRTRIIVHQHSIDPQALHEATVPAGPPSPLLLPSAQVELDDSLGGAPTQFRETQARALYTE